MNPRTGSSLLTRAAAGVRVLRLLGTLMMPGSLVAGDASSTIPVPADEPRGRALGPSVESYYREAQRRILEEANQVARALRLEEPVPITDRDLIQVYITPPDTAQDIRMLGTLATANYDYRVSCDNKLSAVELIGIEDKTRAWIEQYSWPVKLLDTNAAYQLATQWLYATSVDVAALNRDCTVAIDAIDLGRTRLRKRFAPIYDVCWPRKVKGSGPAAEVRLFAPTRTLMLLYVAESKYILRDPIRLPDPYEGYKRAVARLIIQEANQVARALELPEKLPIVEADVTTNCIAAPDLARQTKAPGTISTKDYLYFVTRGNKFSAVCQQKREENRRKWVEDYSWPIQKMDTNSAYHLATQWLAAVSVDVAGLNRDCSLRVISASREGGKHRKTFAPLYFVAWLCKPPLTGSAAAVEVFLPTKTLVYLFTEDEKYILRTPVKLPELAASLDAPKERGATVPNTPEAK